MAEGVKKRKQPSTFRSGRSPGRIAVIDIGSNTVRMVVYDAPTRLPIPMFNEKAQCELGRGLSQTGRLRPDGVTQALQSLARFTKLARSMGVDRLSLVATAAVRDAGDGPDFVKTIKKSFGHGVEVLSGEEEAKLAAIGLIGGVPDADGLLGDLGGGSLDLVAIDRGVCGECATMPLGHLRLLDDSNGRVGKAAALMAEHLAKVDWLPAMRGRPFHAVGGSWRAIARLIIEQTNYPLHVIDNYKVDREEALRVAKVVSGLSSQSLEKVRAISRKRAETLPYAAAALRVILETVGPSEVVFSGFGMREGKLLQCLPKTMRSQDPFLEGCGRLADKTGRFAISGEEIFDWLQPIFPGERPKQARSRLAACILSDIGWPEHPDYRAEHAFHRVLRTPFMGLSHPARVLLALAVYIRYNGDRDSPLVEPLKTLLDTEQTDRVETLGLSLKLAHTISGSAPGILAKTRLEPLDGSLVLRLPRDPTPFLSDTVVRRLRALARNLGMKPVVVANGDRVV